MSVFLDINTLNENPLRHDFMEEDEEYRYAYAEDFLNTYIATQIKVLRDERGMKQGELAEAIGTKQSGISRLENVNYSNWKTETLRKVARAFGLRLRISFETFGSLLSEDADFSRESLKRPKFEDDPVFAENMSNEVTEGVRDTSRGLRSGLKVIAATSANSIQTSLPFDRPAAVSVSVNAAHTSSARQGRSRLRTVKRVRRQHVRKEAA
jgi:transcriptional regulator with XRE-family HTH domain